MTKGDTPLPSGEPGHDSTAPVCAPLPEPGTENVALSLLRFLGVSPAPCGADAGQDTSLTRVQMLCAALRDCPLKPR